jgi:hypothetical protein
MKQEIKRIKPNVADPIRSDRIFVREKKINFKPRKQYLEIKQIKNSTYSHTC